MSERRDAPRHVSLLGPNGRWRPSMDRFTDQLARAAYADDLEVRAPFARDSPGRREHAPGSEWSRRWVRYPLTARRERADVYHVTDHSYGHLAAVLPPARTVVTCHDLLPILATTEDIGFTLPRRALLQYRASVMVMRRAHHLVAVSESTRRDMVRFLGIDPDRVTVILNGVDDVFRPGDPNSRAARRAALGLDGSTVLVHVGAAPYKDLATVVGVLGAVRRAGLDATLLQIGESWPGNVWRLADDLGVARHIRSVGPVSDHRLVEIFTAADVLVFPSLSEGYGWPPAEAMACGLPVVVSDAPALREVVAGGGLHAPRRDVQALAYHVLSLAENATTWQQWSRAALARSEQLTLSDTVGAYANVYRLAAAARATTNHHEENA